MLTYRIFSTQIPFLDDTKIEDYATELAFAYAEKCGVADLPFDVEDLIWSLLSGRDNLELETGASLGCDQSGERIIGSTSGDYRSGIIRIDDSISHTPLFWFTIAHELGHWILHRDILASASNGTMSLHRDVQNSQGHQFRREEWQANRFATHLLMPEPRVRAEFARLVSNAPLNYTEKCKCVGRFAQRHPTLREYSRIVTTQGRPFDIRSRFRVSKEAMAIRMEELGLVVR